MMQQVPQHTPPPSRQPQQPPVENHTPTAGDIQATKRTSSSALSNTSTTDYDETFSDLDSTQGAIASSMQSHHSSRATSPGDQNTPTRKSKTSALRLSLKSLRAPKISSQTSIDEQSSDIHSGKQPIEDARISYGRRTSQETRPHEERTSFDGVDPHRRDQLSTSAPKNSNRFSFIHSTAPSTPTMSRSSHCRSLTTPLSSPNPSSYGTSPRRAITSPSPRPVKETHTMMKDYDPMTGNKMINKYMVVRELGRGVHGKVKLCRDTETDELC
ncbi:hypothetical protein BGX20_005503, partial [Mortierella sp. AD010]